jgi:transcriptional regulator with PAS, ATPase and Fis domain
MLRDILENISAVRYHQAQQAAARVFLYIADLGFTYGAAVVLIEIFEDAALKAATEADFQAAVREVGRFLMREAIAVLVDPVSTSKAPESEMRPVARPRDLGLLGRSSQMVQLRRDLAAAAGAAGPVMLVGESGTGKELAALAIHRGGRAKHSPFVAVNCAALPRDLVESELFGHERGAFTGSSRDGAPGLLRAAGDGTIFLDEVTEMPLSLQPKLLRALEQRSVRPVGGVREYDMRARVVAATNRDPEAALASGSIRPDLYYRLCVHCVFLPPLREHPDDIPVLCHHFLDELRATGYRAPGHISDAALEALAAYSWPGNVRELRNAMEHCVAVSRGESLDTPHLPRFMGRRSASPGGAEPRPKAAQPGTPHLELEILSDVERRHIKRALELTGGNKTVAAKLLGLSRHQLYVRIVRLGLGD